MCEVCYPDYCHGHVEVNKVDTQLFEELKNTIRGLEYSINTGQRNWLHDLKSHFPNEKGQPHPAEVWRREMSQVINKAMDKIEPPCNTCGALFSESHKLQECCDY